MAEELGLQQRLGEGGAVDRDEGLAPPRAAVVQRARHQLLAGAALAGDQHGRVALGDGLDPVGQAQHRRAASDDGARPRSRSVRLALRQLGARLLQLPLERPLGGDPLQLEDDLVEVERLGEVVVGAFLERRDGVVDRGVGGDEDDVGPRRLLAHPAEQRQPVDLGQPDVADHDVEDVRRDLGQPLGAVRGQADAMACVAEGVAYQHPKIGFVIDQEDVEHSLGTLRGITGAVRGRRQGGDCRNVADLRSTGDGRVPGSERGGAACTRSRPAALAA